MKVIELKASGVAGLKPYGVGVEWLGTGNGFWYWVLGTES